MKYIALPPLYCHHYNKAKINARIILSRQNMEGMCVSMLFKQRKALLSVMMIMIFMAAAACGQASPPPTTPAEGDVSASVVPSTSAAGASEAATQSTAAESEAPEEAPTEVTVLVTNSMGNDPSKVLTTKMNEEATNTKMIFIEGGAGNDYLQKLNTVMASGEYPDIIAVTDNPTEKMLVENSVLLPLNQYWDQYANIRDCRDEDTWNIMTHPDGNVYCIPRNGKIGEQVINHTNWHFNYRQDYLEKSGLSELKTLDDYWKFCEYIRDGDPDGNGENDTYAIIGYSSQVPCFEHIISAFGVQYNYWMERGGKVVNGSVQPEMKEALKYINRMYEAGFIDPEFITDSQQRFIDKYQQGMLGAGMHWAHCIDTKNLQGFYAALQQNAPGAVYVHGGDLLTTEGYTPFGYRRPSQRGWSRTAVAASSKVLDAALRIVNFECSEQAMLMNAFGIEGETYTIDQDGVVDFFATVEQQKEIGISTYHALIVLTNRFDHVSKVYQNAMLRQNELEGPPQVSDVRLVSEISEYESTLNSFVDEWFIRFITGDLDIDGNWDSFLTEWDKRGGTKIADALTAAGQS
jgi:ABC-type glycerol-3-phosphate transport system substrate-binding protein